jgi:hypothetical protein
MGSGGGKGAHQSCPIQIHARIGQRELHNHKPVDRRQHMFEPQQRPS